MRARQMQWLFGVNMPAGRSIVLPGQDEPPLAIEWGPVGGPIGNPSALQSDYPFTVPAGHVLGLTMAAIASKHALSGYTRVLPIWFNATAPTFELRPDAMGGFTMLPLADMKGSVAPDPTNNGAESGVAAASYLVLLGITSVPDVIGTVHFRPPLLLLPGFVLRIGLANNHGAQWMHVVVQGVLIEVPEGVAPDEIMLDGGWRLT